jgi:hypothetical protein
MHETSSKFGLNWKSLCSKTPFNAAKCLWDKPFIVLEVSEFLGRTKVGGMSHDHA